MLDDVLDESLQRLAMTGPEYGSGLSNHGPMAAEALVRLGRPDAVEVWVTGYLKKLDDRPRSVDPIGSDWQSALGAFSRVADWDSYFHGS